MKPPPIGWTTPVKLDREGDGDTLTISVERKLIIRLVDDQLCFDAPETYRPKSDAERKHGEAATKFLHQLLHRPDGSPRDLILHIPGDPQGKVSHMICIGGRFIGMLFADGIDVVQVLEDNGFAKRNDYES